MWTVVGPKIYTAVDTVGTLDSGHYLQYGTTCMYPSFVFSCPSPTPYPPLFSPHLPSPLHFFLSPSLPLPPSSLSSPPLPSSPAAKNKLVIFDFDNTMIDGNIDLIVFDLDCTLRMYSTLRHWTEVHPVWTDYMAASFAEMHSVGITPQSIEEIVREVSIMPGVEELCKHLASKDDVEMIVVSDANDLFINWILESNGLNSFFSKVYSNPAAFADSGKLLVKHYHSHSCKRCPANMCKAEIIRQHMQGRSFERVAYFGDGHGDVCPSLSLSADDLVFARNGYTMARHLTKSAAAGKLKAKLVLSDFGEDLLAEFKSHFGS